MKTILNNEQKWIAIDIALIPEEKAWEELKKLNQSLGVCAHSFSFDHNHRPHLTLWQDFVLASEINILSKKISQQTWDIPDVVELNGLNVLGTLEAGAYTPCLELLSTDSNTSRILVLHRLVADLSKVYGGQGKIKRGEFFGDLTHEKCHHYVQQFGAEKSGENFFPHITLGVGPDIAGVQRIAKLIDWPWKVNMSSLVLAQLGDVCSVSSQIYWEKKI